MNPVRAYQVIGVMVLAGLGWADYRGWSFGTESENDVAADCVQPTTATGTNTQPCNSNRGSIRNRSYIGGK